MCLLMSETVEDGETLTNTVCVQGFILGKNVFHKSEQLHEATTRYQSKNKNDVYSAKTNDINSF